MTIESRELPAGTRLVATHKKQAFACTVEEGEDGRRAYVLADGRRYASPSAAGSAVMGGVACNGWRFWNQEGGEPPAASTGTSAKTGKVKTAKASGKKGSRKAQRPNGGGHGGHPLLHPTAIQEGVAAGETAWFCDACMATFTASEGEEPQACPEGHRADDPQLAAVS